MTTELPLRNEQRNYRLSPMAQLNACDGLPNRLFRHDKANQPSHSRLAALLYCNAPSPDAARELGDQVINPHSA